MPDYYVKTIIKGSTPTTSERLVRAKNVAGAIAHVVKDTVVVEKASADTIIRLTKANVDIEVAE